MDRPLEELQQLTLGEVLRESVSIPRASPRTFALITLALVFPLSIAILFTHPITQSHETTTATSSPPPPPCQLRLAVNGGHPWAFLFLYLLYPLFLFTISLLATAAVVFTVASIYAAKPVSFLSTLNAIPRVFSRLFRTFLWVSLIMFVYDSAFLLAVILVILVSGGGASSACLGTAALIVLVLIVLVFLSVHVFISALWHLASVITVLEPVCGLAAMKKSRELLQGRTRMALAFVLWYLGSCGLIGTIFWAVVVRAGEEDGVQAFPMVVRVLVGGALVVVLVVVNLVGLLVQSVFYYVCKSYHHQSVDKTALYEHLGGYLGEHVPLKSSIQMESFEL